MAHGAAHDAAQNITAAFIGGHNAISQKEAGRTQMVGDDAMTGLLFANSLRARQFF